MWFGILGHLAVRRPDGTDVPIPGPARRQVLAALLCRPGAILTTTALVEDLWGLAPPRSALNSLRSHVVRLRTALAQGGAENLLVTVGDGYRLDIAPDDVDAGRFEALIEEASRTLDPAAAIERYDAALALWRDEPYVEFGDAPFAVLERIRLAELRALARERRTDLALETGTGNDLVAELEQRVRSEPYRERGWEQLALALYRGGRQADALTACRRARAVLVADLGVDPGRALQTLEQRLLEQDPGLLLALPASPVTAQAVLDRCPYLGLAGYQEQDAALFVGRERLTSMVAGRLADQSVVVVTGASGVGKSSLVRAGLVPALRSGALPGSSSWRIEVRTPATVVLDDQQRRPDLLVLDQAEELFTGMNPAERDDIVRRLARYVAEHEGRIVVVLRSDFFGRLADLGSVAPYADKTALLVGPMRADELRRALVEPAARAGLRLEDELIETVMDDVAGQAEPLPLLSEAMVRTWQRREGPLLTLKGYEQAGELAGAVEAAAEECYVNLDEEQQRAARRLLVRMAARGDAGWVRRPVTRAEPADVAEQQALSALIAARLVVSDERRIEMAHEALLAHWPRLRGWLEERRLAADLLDHLDQAAAEWHTAGRRDSDLYRGPRLAAATDWRADHPEDLSATEVEFLDASAGLADAELRTAQGQTRRARTVAVALAVVVVLAVAGGAVALYERSSARTEARRAQHAAITSDAQRLAALSANAPDTATANQLALAAYRLQDTGDTRAALLAAVERTKSALWRLSFPSRIFEVHPTPDGARLLVPLNRTVWIVDPASHRRVAHFRLASSTASFVGVTADGRHGVVDDQGQISVVAIPSGRQERVVADVGSGGPAPVLTYSGRWLAVDRASNRPGTHVLQIFDTRDWATPPRVLRAAAPPTVLSAGRSAVGVEYADGSVDVWTLPSLRRVGRVARTATKPVLTGIAVSPDGSLVARLGPRDKTEVTLYRSRQARTAGLRLPPIPAVGDTFWSAAFSPDGSALVIGSSGGPVTVYRCADGSVIDSFVGNGGQTFGVAWTGSAAPSGLYSVGLDGQLISWDVSSEPRLLTESGTDYVGVRASLGTNVAVRRSREVLAMGAPAGRTTAQWRLAIGLGTGKINLWPAGAFDPQACCTFMTVSDDGRLALSSVPDRNAGIRNDLYDLHTGKIVWRQHVPAADGAPALNAAMSPDGKLAYVNLSRTRIAVYALPSGGRLRTFDVEFPRSDSDLQSWPWTVDPAGRLVIVGAHNGPHSHVGLVDPSSGKLLADVDVGDIGQVSSMTWSNDRRQVAVGTFNGTLFLLDADTLAIRDRVNALEPGTVRSISFSPDDQTLVTAGDTGELDFWSLPRLGHELHLVIGDGRVFAAYDTSGRLVGLAPDPTRPGEDMYRWFVFRSDPASVAAAACSLAGGSLTRAQWQRYAGNEAYRQICR